jgi:hypothetical protein
MEWKSVQNFEGRYEVSDEGMVRNCSGKVLSPRVCRKGGHLRVALFKDGVRSDFMVHRLVLEAFVGPCPDGMEGCHNDGDPANNRETNLRWGTRSENQLDRHLHGTMLTGENHPNSKLTDDQVREIRRRVANGEQKQTLAEEFHLSDVAVGKLVRRQTYRSVA